MTFIRRENENYSSRANILISFDDYYVNGHPNRRGGIYAFTYFPNNSAIKLDNTELWASKKSISDNTYF